MVTARPRKKTDGYTCPVCRGTLRVTSTRRPCEVITVRYRTCVACGHKLVTEERPRADCKIVSQ